jgi:hypothetical protein
VAKLYSRSFNGGIVSPEMFGRIDDIKYNTGLKQCENFIVLPQGPVESRPGFQFVRGVRDSTKVTRLIPFRFSTTQTTVLEFSEARIRFHTFGATLLASSAGLSAWDSATAYVVGDQVTAASTIFQCVVANTNEDPTDPANQVGGSPASATAWSLTVAASPTPPSGYTNVGDSLPLTVVVGQQVYIRVYSWGTEVIDDPFLGPISVPVAVEEYVGYTGVTVTAPGGFWQNLGPVSVDPVPYEVVTPYAENDISSLTYVQSGDVMTICHPRYKPHELRRLGAAAWVMAPITFGSVLAAPAISSVTPTTATSPSDTQSYSYVATNVTEDQLDESGPSTPSSATNQLFDTGARNTVAFAAAGRRNVYKLSGGQYGFVGQTDTTSFIDDNIAADTSRTPPQNQDPFAADYPGAVGYFEQRRIFGGTILLPQTLWMTKSGTESNLDYSIPVRDDDAISVRMAAREASIIRHIVPVGELLVLTDSGEWVVSSTDGGSITPYTISLRPQSYIGANLVQPVVVGTSAVYAAARGGHVRAAGFDFDVNSYVSIDMSLRAAHLFDYKTIVDMAYAKGPVPIVWAVSSDGSLLGMTYVPEQQVYAWHRHTTDGRFESICVVGEGNDDVLYAVVRRTINNVSVRYVERMASRFYTVPREYFGVDCGLTYSGASTSVISGLGHLEGKTVAVYANGGVQGSKTVSSGSITLDDPATYAHVGLPVSAYIETLPVAAEIEAYAQATIKNVSKVTARVANSGAFEAGPALNRMTKAKMRTTEPYGSPPALRTGEIEVSVAGSWKDDGTIFIRRSNPVPLTVTSMTIELVFGG